MSQTLTLHESRIQNIPTTLIAPQGRPDGTAICASSNILNIKYKL